MSGWAPPPTDAAADYGETLINETTNIAVAPPHSVSASHQRWSLARLRRTRLGWLKTDALFNSARVRVWDDYVSNPS
jgi:hypothetical protein